MAKGDPKSPSDAALLGILFVGLGHFYLGMWGKGIGLILITIIATIFTTVFIAPVFWIISCVWAYYDAKSYNREWGYSDFGKKITVEDVEDVEEETEGDQFCTNCGKPLLQDDNFCPGCGKSTVRAAPSDINGI
jgi:hypothetical protein